MSSDDDSFLFFISQFSVSFTMISGTRYEVYLMVAGSFGSTSEILPFDFCSHEKVQADRCNDKSDFDT